MKKFLFIFIALVINTVAYAQIASSKQSFEGPGRIPGVEVKEKSNALFLGPKIGANLSSMTNPNECDLYDGMGFGYSVGLSLKTRFGKSSEYSMEGTGLFGVGVDVLYKTNSVKTIGTNQDGKNNANLSLNYIDVPVYLQLYPFVKSYSMNTFYVELGASFASIISRSPKSLTVLNPNSNYSSVTYELDMDGSRIKGFDVRPLVGVGYTIPETSLDVNVRYLIGASKLAGNFPCKISSLELSLSWMFNVGKF